MNREQAESLLALLVFDDLEEPARSQLLEYLKTDPELNERLGDMRLTAKLLGEAVEAGDAPKLDTPHREALKKNIERDNRNRGVIRIIGRTRMHPAIAALVVISTAAILIGLLLPSLGAARRSSRQMTTTTQARGIGQSMFAYAQDNDGRYPERVSQLVEGNYLGPQYLISPDSNTRLPSNFDRLSQQEQNAWIDQNSSFKLLIKGEKAESRINPNRVVGYMEHGDSEGVSVAFADGRASFEKAAELPELLHESGLDYVDIERIQTGDIARSDQLALVTPPAEIDDFTAQQSRIDAARRKLAMKRAEADVGQGEAVAGTGIVTNQPQAGQPASGERFAGRGGTWYGQTPTPAEPPVDNINSGSSSRGNTSAEQTGEVRWRVTSQSGSTLGESERGTQGYDHPQSSQSAAKPTDAGAGYAGGYGEGRAGYAGEEGTPTVGGYAMGGYGEAVTNDRSDVVALNESKPADAPSSGVNEFFSRRSSRTEVGAAVLGGAVVLGDDVMAEAESSPASTSSLAVATPLTSLPQMAQQVQEGTDFEHLSVVGVYDMEDWNKKVAQMQQSLTGAGRKSAAKTSREIDIKEGVEVMPEQTVLGNRFESAEESLPARTPEFRLYSNLSPKDEEPAPARKPKLMPVNPWVMTADDRLSTFALDVDTASYDIARRYINDGFLPPRHTVRMEEFVNSFDYNYPAEQLGSEAFGVYAEGAPSPFGQNTVLLKIGVRGKVVGRDQAKPANLVFVIDTSGSMDRDDRLPLVRKSLAMALDQLSQQDRVSVVSYGTEARLLIEAAPAGNKQQILDTLENLQTGGSTNLLSGVELGYEVARRQFITNGVNRVILNSDGVANVGPSEAEELIKQAQDLREQGVSFTSVGFGAGNYDDKTLEQLANTGDGEYLFVGSLDEARRVFVDQLAATRPTIAYDAKVQVGFDPARVRRYRLIGYENRDIADTDFRNDTVDAGEVGSGQSATALYELELIGPIFATGDEPDLGTVYVRYRDADTAQVREIESRLTNEQITRMGPAEHPRFYLAAGAARFAEVLRGSEHLGDPDINRNLVQVQNIVDVAAAQLPLDKMAQELPVLVSRAQGLPRAE